MHARLKVPVPPVHHPVTSVVKGINQCQPTSQFNQTPSHLSVFYYIQAEVTLHNFVSQFISRC